MTHDLSTVVFGLAASLAWGAGDFSGDWLPVVRTYLASSSRPMPSDLFCWLRLPWHGLNHFPPL
ncbi:MAG TPA: hypothetical protein VKB35_11470 [Ktedonobacteraceae bacterium]|nr:hypothetical protein [Ktedonobacteraceae bacterium]